MDIICQAKSGMGKTAVFVLSTLHHLASSTDTEPSVKVVVLCHTRELAFQIQKEYERFSKYLPEIKSKVFYGGINIKEDITYLSTTTPDIIVATPGRLVDLLKRNSRGQIMTNKDKDTPLLSLNKVKHFIVDECDRLLNEISFRRDLQEVFKATPHDKQVMFFSATYTEEARAIANKFCQNPVQVSVDSNQLTLHGLTQYYVSLKEEEKNRKLCDLLDSLDFNQVVIFVSKAKRATELDKLLNDCNFPSIHIHSSLKQEERIKRFKQFKNFEYRILVATDLFGRGIDIERVNVVINYDFPEDADQYLHRVGRAGRFGTKGLAISFLSSEQDQEIFKKVQEKFATAVPEIPESIDSSSYM